MKTKTPAFPVLNQEKHRKSKISHTVVMLLLLLQKQKSCIEQNRNPPRPYKTVTITEAKVTSVSRQHAFMDQGTQR